MLCVACTSYPGLCVFRWPVSWWLLRVSWSVQRNVLSCLRGEPAHCRFIITLSPYWPAITCFYKIYHFLSDNLNIMLLLKCKCITLAFLSIYLFILHALLTCMYSLFGMALCCLCTCAHRCVRRLQEELNVLDQNYKSLKSADEKVLHTNTNTLPGFL